MSSFQYRKRSAQAVKESAEGNDSKYFGWLKAGIKIWTPQKEIHRVRFVSAPYAGEVSAIGYRCVVHPNIGPEEVTHLCRKAMLKEADAVEERLSDARRNKQMDEKWAWSMKPKIKFPTYLVDEDDLDKGVQCWPMAEQTNSALDRACIDRNGAVIEVEHHDHGLTVEVETVMKRGKKNNNEYTTYEFQVIGRPAYLSEDEDEQDRWVKFVEDNPLDQILKFHTYDETVEALGEVSHGRESREDDRPRSRSDRRGRSRQTEPAGGADYDERRPSWDDTGAGSSADDAAPPRSRRRRAEPEDSREEEPPPSSRRRRAEPEPEPEPEPERQETTGRRRRSAPAEAEPEGPAPRSRRRAPAEVEPEEPAPRARRAPAEAEPEEPAPRTRRRAPAAEPEAEEPAPRTRRRAPAEAAPAEAPPDEELAPRRRRAPAEASRDLADDVGAGGLGPAPDESPRSEGRRRRAEA